MQSSLPLPLSPRTLALVAGGIALAALCLIVVRPLLLGSDSGATATPAPQFEATPAPTPRTAKTKVALLPGLPAPLARELRTERVVVVAVYAGRVPADRTVVAEARAGAADVGAGFVPMNVFDEQTARSLDRFAGAPDSPAVLVVRRPGKVVGRFDGVTERAIVAQAAANAGARS